MASPCSSSSAKLVFRSDSYTASESKPSKGCHYVVKSNVRQEEGGRVLTTIGLCCVSTPLANDQNVVQVFQINYLVPLCMQPASASGGVTVTLLLERLWLHWHLRGETDISI